MDKNLFDWLVIGAGPAGIAAVGKLLDQGVEKEKIGWLDPLFKVGDLGTKWQNVPSNTQVGLFNRFLNDCISFKYKDRKMKFPLDDLDPSNQCLLKEIAAPLQWVTDHLTKTVVCIKGEAFALNLIEGLWEVKVRPSEFLKAKNVILCTGAEPKSLAYHHVQYIPLEIALDPDKLSKEVTKEDTVAVFGSSHSAVLVLAALADIKPKMIYNFYLVPPQYAIHLDDWILFDNTGLKGFAAEWSRKYLHGARLSYLECYPVSDRLFEETFSMCNKVIYAVGFERRKLPVLEQFPGLDYQETTGVIAPGLFGLGIAYPQAQLDPLGNKEYRVGLWKFMDYLNTILPIWLKYAN